MSDATDATGGVSADDVGGRCMWCGAEHANHPCGRLPIPGTAGRGDGGGHVHETLCINCWAEQAADHTAIREDVATVLAIKHLGFGRETVASYVPETRRRLQKKRRELVTEVAPTDPPTRTLLEVIGIAVPPASVRDDADGPA